MRWLWLLLCLALPSHAAQVTFAWDAQPTYPQGVTYELQANGVTATGITGTSYTLTVPDGPGQPLAAQVRAKAAGYTDSAWTTFSGYVPGATVPNAVVNLRAANTQTGGGVTNPSFAELGTLDNKLGSSVNSLSSNIANVSTNDIVFAVIQRRTASNLTGVSGTGFGTWTQLAAVDTNIAGIVVYLYSAIATSSAATRTITASFSNSDVGGRMFTVRYNPGSGLASLTPLSVTYNPASAIGEAASSTTRGSANADLTISSNKTALVVAFGTDLNSYLTHTGANGFTKRADSQNLGSGNQSPQFFYDSIKTAGTYGGTGTSQRVGTVSTADTYSLGLVALEVVADSNPAAVDTSTILQAVNAAQW